MKIEKLYHNIQARYQNDATADFYIDIQNKINELVDAVNGADDVGNFQGDILNIISRKIQKLEAQNQELKREEEPEPEILNCPFCGQFPNIEVNKYNEFKIECTNSDCPRIKTPIWTEEEEAIQAWNRRA